ncbi:hypothetical protein D3C73_921090 [compost metagenome]
MAVGGGQRFIQQRMHGGPCDVGVTGLLAAARFVGHAPAAGGHGFADGHKRFGDVSIRGVVLEPAAADGVFRLQYHGGLHLGAIADFAGGRVERAHQLENALPDAGGVDTDVFHVVFFGQPADGFGLRGEIHAFPLVALQYAEFAAGDHRRSQHHATGAVAGVRRVIADPHRPVTERSACIGVNVRPFDQTVDHTALQLLKGEY